MNEYRNNTCTSAASSEGRTRKHAGRIRWIALALCCLMLGGIIGAGGSLALAADTTSEMVFASSSEPMSAADIYEQNVGSTVGITTSATTNIYGYTTQSAASGSGFIITADGYILTNFHVIEDAETITVSMYDDSSYEAELIGYDESNDIAILKIDASGLTPVTLGDSDALRVGDDVIAIGNPLGELTFSLTRGIVSALNRSVTLSSGKTLNLIQTDCAINAGNSGGALFNMYGEVIGITNAKYSSNGFDEVSVDNVGFAIPINSVANIVKSIIENGYIVKPYIGVSITNVSEESQGFGLPKGAAVKAVNENSPAEAAGLQVNDIITAVDGEEISGSDDLVNIVKASSAGDVKTLTVYRQGEILEIQIEIGEQVQSALAREEEAAESSSSASQEPSSSQDQQPNDYYDEFQEFMKQFGFDFGF